MWARRRVTCGLLVLVHTGVNMLRDLSRDNAASQRHEVLAAASLGIQRRVGILFNVQLASPRCYTSKKLFFVNIYFLHVEDRKQVC